MAPMHFPSVDPRRLRCKKFASIMKFVQENQVMRIVASVSAFESKDLESDAEEEKYGEMPELIPSSRDASIIRVN